MLDRMFGVFSPKPHFDFNVKEAAAEAAEQHPEIHNEKGWFGIAFDSSDEAMAAFNGVVSLRILEDSLNQIIEDSNLW